MPSSQRKGLIRSFFHLRTRLAIQRVQCDGRAPIRSTVALTVLVVPLILQGCVASINKKASFPGAAVRPLSLVRSDYHRNWMADETFSDAYTRLVVSDRTCDGPAKARPLCKGDDFENDQLPYSTRPLIRRWLSGRHDTLNLTASITVGAFAATVPLVTIDHVSNATDGESFTRVVGHELEKFPLFLIKGDSSNAIASVQFAVKGSEGVQSNSASVALQVAQSVIKNVAPQSAVLTTLTEQSAKNVATSIDSTVNQLFSKKLDEEQWLENDVRRWNEGVSVTLKIPLDEGEWHEVNVKEKSLVVGTWVVSFDLPRPSIFSDRQICYGTPGDRVPAAQEDSSGSGAQSTNRQMCFPSYKAAALQAETDADARPHSVLAFQLVNGSQSLGTVEAYLKQQSWWSAAMKTFAKSPTKDDVVDFCRNIKTSIVSLNLNTVDAAIVVNAVRNASILPLGVANAMAGTGNIKNAESVKGDCDYQFPLPARTVHQYLVD